VCGGIRSVELPVVLSILPVVSCFSILYSERGSLLAGYGTHGCLLGSPDLPFLG
jgi:hypothetical protein